MNPKSKYNRKLIGINGIETITDAYRVLVAFNVVEPENQHAIKKQLCLGSRGKASYMQDLDEAILSLEKLRERKKQEEQKEPEKKVSKHPKCKINGCENRGCQKGCLCKKHKHIPYIILPKPQDKPMIVNIPSEDGRNIGITINAEEHKNLLIKWAERNLNIAFFKNIK